MNKFVLPIFAITSFLLLAGCAEGPLWQTGHFVPWAKNRWEQENQLAATLQRRTNELNRAVDQATSDAELQEVATQLGDIVKRDPVLLVRLHAVSLLGKVNHPAAIQHLKDATTDAESRIRIAAVESWRQMPGELAIPLLQEVIGSDTDVDVRLSAAKTLGHFENSRAAEALSLALSDANPAIQFRAMESLQKITGKNFGSDVAAWQNHISTQSNTSIANAQETLGLSNHR